MEDTLKWNTVKFHFEYPKGARWLNWRFTDDINAYHPYISLGFHKLYRLQT